MKKGEIKGLISSYQTRIQSIELQMKNQEIKNAENEKWRNKLGLAEAIYDKLSADFRSGRKRYFTN